MKVFGIFSLLAIFVTSLGISGLSSFMITQRTKEIGIRKVLGAGIVGIFHLLTKDFVMLILVSFIIVTPLSYFGIEYWLESYAVKMSLTVWLFLIPLLIILLATLITALLHILKAATMNPIKSLRYE
jgi:putative ABC transport system permease protein